MFNLITSSRFYYVKRLEVFFMAKLALRQRTGLSQSKFAEKFHLNINTVIAWEHGTCNFPERLQYLIGRVLDLEEENEALRNT